MKPVPHYREMLNADGTINLSVLMRIAAAHARADKVSGDTYQRIFARALRADWQLANSYRASFLYKQAA